MKITTFNPLIATKNAEPVVKLFEELGFEQKHSKINVMVSATGMILAVSQHIEDRD